ncbi:MAG: hypothetical protein HY735_37120 [Verrucomicrobia bacterium]|nr:hypothetical protein [Verrucomicrobiota bacterium]
MTAEQVYLEATKRGLRLKPVGDKLAVIPAKGCPPEFAETLRRHKVELLDLLEAKSHNLSPDCVTWLHIARQILAGEFEGCDKSTRESLAFGLRSIGHPLARCALGRLGALRPEVH